MKWSTQVLWVLLLLILAGCDKIDNGPVEPQRLSVDTINLKNILNSNDPIAVRNGLEIWLQDYPEEINRVFPNDATTPLGLVGQKYFTADDKSLWLELVTLLLDKGADPNIFLNYMGSRHGLAHLAADKNDQSLLKFLIKKQGTVDPPLRLSCEFLAIDSPVRGDAESSKLRLNLNLQEVESALTPLHYAVKRPSPDAGFIEFLLLKGANPDVSDSSLMLVSPFQLASSNLSLLPIFQKYSGTQIRYDARLNSFINDEIEAKSEFRKTILDLAKAYQELVVKEGFQTVQDFNRVIPLCKTGEHLNLMGYALQYLIPTISTKVAQTAKTRNDSIQSWLKDYNAKICATDKLSILNSQTQEFRELTVKELFKETLITHTNAATAPVKNINKSLWCTIVKPKAIEDGCWDPLVDDVLLTGIQCAL